MPQQEVCQLFEYNADSNSEDSSMTPHLRNPALSHIIPKHLETWVYCDIYTKAFYTPLSVSQRKACFDSNEE